MGNEAHTTDHTGSSTARVVGRLAVFALLALAAVAILLGAAAPAGAAGKVRYVATNRAGQPVKWDGQRTIRYQLNTGGDESRRNQVGQALATVTQATGIAFQYTGDTAHVPTTAQPMPASVWNAADRNTPYDVIIAFAGPHQTDMVGGARRGLAVQRWTTEFLHGTVVVDTRLTPGWGVGQQGSVLLHELAHLVGLDHVDDPSSLMFPTDGDTSTLSPTDWDALRTLGNGRGLTYDPARLPANIPTAAPIAPAPPAAPAAAVPAATAPAVPAPAVPAPAAAPAAPAAAPAAETRAASTNTTTPTPAVAVPGDNTDPFETMLVRAY